MFGLLRVVASLTVIVFSIRIAAADESPPAERRLPGPTMQFAVVRNIATLRRQLGAGAAVSLQTNPEPNGVADRHDRDLLADLPLRGKLLLYDSTESLSPVRPQRWRSRARGEAAAALFRDSTGELAAVWLIDADDNVGILAEDSEWIAKWFTDGPSQRTEIVVRNNKCTLFDRPKQARRRAGFQRMAFVAKGTYLVIATSKEGLEMVLDRWDGAQQDTLADDEEFQRMRRRTSADGNDTGNEITWFRRFEKNPRFTDRALSDAWFPGKFVMALLNSQIDVTGEVGRDLLDGTAVCSGGMFAVTRDGRGIVSRQSEILRQD